MLGLQSKVGVAELAEDPEASQALLANYVSKDWHIPPSRARLFSC